MTKRIFLGPLDSFKNLKELYKNLSEINDIPYPRRDFPSDIAYGSSVHDDLPTPICPPDPPCVGCGTPTPTPTLTSTPGLTPTATSTPAPTATSTPAPTATSTPAPTATSTPAPTATSTPAITPSASYYVGLSIKMIP